MMLTAINEPLYMACLFKATYYQLYNFFTAVGYGLVVLSRKGGSDVIKSKLILSFFKTSFKITIKRWVIICFVVAVKCHPALEAYCF